MEKLSSKIKHNLGRAFNMSDASVTRDRIDRDETAANTEFALSRGKETRIREHNRKAGSEGEKIHRRMVGMRSSRGR